MSSDQTQGISISVGAMTRVCKIITREQLKIALGEIRVNKCMQCICEQ